MFVFVVVLFDVANDEVAKEDPGPLLGGENTWTLGGKVSRDSFLAVASSHIVRRHPCTPGMDTPTHISIAAKVFEISTCSTHDDVGDSNTLVNDGIMMAPDGLTVMAATLP